LRKSIEVASIRLAIKRAKDEDIDALLKFLEATGPIPASVRPSSWSSWMRPFTSG
jgi:hypothetical protein